MASIIGIGLICVSVAPCVWIVTTVATSISGRSTPALIDKINPYKNDTMTITTPAGDLRIPGHAFAALAYFLLFLLLLLPTIIACKLLSGGIHLLQSEEKKPKKTPS
jgi:hypothetical protein